MMNMILVWVWLVAAMQAPSAAKQAVVETSAGTFVIDLAADAAPNQTAYFMKLASERAYDGTTFHRMVKYGIVQGGDPLSWIHRTYRAVLDTSAGPITIEFFPDKAPGHVRPFLRLAQAGVF